MSKVSFVTARIRSLREGNVLSHVCLPFHIGRGAHVATTYDTISL